MASKYVLEKWISWRVFRQSTDWIHQMASTMLPWCTCIHVLDAIALSAELLLTHKSCKWFLCICMLCAIHVLTYTVLAMFVLTCYCNSKNYRNSRNILSNLNLTDWTQFDVSDRMCYSFSDLHCVTQWHISSKLTVYQLSIGCIDWSVE